MLGINVLTISGKNQKFYFDPKTLVSDIKNQIIRNHPYLNVPTKDEWEFKLLYKGVELDDFKNLENYNITDESNIQIITKSKPVSIGNNKKNDFSGSNKLMCSSSLPNFHNTSIFESYAPSALDVANSQNNILKKLSKSNSPATNNNNLIMNSLSQQQSDDGNIQYQLNRIFYMLDKIMTKIENLEERLDNN